MYCISLDPHKPLPLSFPVLLSLHYYCGYCMMDSWKYLSEQKGMFLSEELDFPFDCSGNGSCNRNNNKVVTGNETRPVYSVENYTPFISNVQAFDGLDLAGMGFTDEIRKSMYSISSEPSGDAFSTGTRTDSCGNVVVSPFCDHGKDSGYHVFTDYAQSKNRGLSVIDLKLGGLVVDGNIPESTDDMSHSVKRVRSGTSMYPRTPCCQVFGCNKDLSSYKGYYKRHKVCDVHTKTAKVIIEGIEQRFCQQCSRFHLLGEFDDGKRSCRRRLAAHNKRRRKPQHVSKSGSRIIGFSSFALPDMFPSSDIDSGEVMGNMVDSVKNNIYNLESYSSMQQQTSSALSLLSAQSHSMPSQLQGAAITSPLINKSIHTNSEKIAQSGSHTPGMYLVGANHVKPAIINHCGDAHSTVDLKFRDDGISVGPYLRNNNNDNTTYHNNNNALGRGIILDLLQLSSHLQRIEHQKHSTESEAG